MKVPTFIKKLTTLHLITLILTSSAMASDNKVIVQPFYDLLSNPGSTAYVEKFKSSVAENWASIGNYSGKNKSQDQFIGQLGGFSKLMPDLNWAVEEMFVDGDSVIVRSRATGTPKGKLFGVDGKGKSFDIMTIDIHTIKDGKISQSYHVEDWSTAIRQLSGK